MEALAFIIPIGLIGIVVLTIILKVLSKYLIASMVVECISAVGIIITGFAMPHSEQINWGWAVSQLLLIFFFLSVCCSCFIFDTEDYLVERYSTDWKDDVVVESYEESRGVFWKTIGACAAISIVLIGLNYLIFVSHAIAIGVIGCLALVASAVSLIKYVVALRRIKTRNNKVDYY